MLRTASLDCISAVKIFRFDANSPRCEPSKCMRWFLTSHCCLISSEALALITPLGSINFALMPAPPAARPGRQHLQGPGTPLLQAPSACRDGAAIVATPHQGCPPHALS